MEYNYLLAQQTVFSKYPNSTYYPLFVVALYSLLEKYNEYRDLVLYIFRQAEIFIEEDTIENILNKHNISYLVFDQEEDFGTSGISSSEDVIVFDNNELVHIMKPPLIVCSNICVSQTELLNIFLHEMNHLIKGAIHSFYFHQNGSNSYYACRTGLYTNYFHYDKDTWNLFIREEFNILDETINTIQATELTQHVFSLDGVIVDEEIQNYINSLNSYEAATDFGYEEATRLIRPLWNDEEFKSLIEENIVEGKTSIIIDRYDSIMGDGAFNNLGLSLDIIDAANDKCKYDKKYKEAKKYIKDVTKQFPKQKRKVLS